MTLHTIVWLASGLIAAVLAVWGVWRLSLLPQGDLSRWGVRGLAPVGVFLAFTLVGPWATSGVRRGTWACQLCWEIEERGSLYGVVVHREPRAASRFEGERGAPVLAWHQALGAFEHEHDFVPVGCHAEGWFAVGCSSYSVADSVSALYCTLETPTGRALSKTWRDAAPQQRRRLSGELASLYRYEGPPSLSRIQDWWQAFRMDSDGRPPDPLSDPDGSLERALAAWRGQRPTWR